MSCQSFIPEHSCSNTMYSDICVVDSNVEVLDTTPLLVRRQQQQEDEDEDNTVVVGAVDYKHTLAVRSNTGRWKSAAFIIGVEMAERIAYYGILGNLINFLTMELGQSMAMAAANVNAWAGVSLLTPILGALIADSWLGKYSTIVAASLLYILGLGLLSVSAMLPSLSCAKHESSTKGTSECLHNLRIILFFVALYLVGAAQGGHKPCVQAFGADQFDGDDLEEIKAKSSFFNWWYFGSAMGSLLGIAVLSYIQDNLSWSLGFGIPCIIMVIALIMFVLGTYTYRYLETREGQSPLYKIRQVFVQAVRNWQLVRKKKEGELENQAGHESDKFRFLHKAMLEDGMSKETCGKSEVEEVKAMLRLFPIWLTSMIFAIVISQTGTFFTKQGVTLERHIGASLVIPAASLQAFESICIVIFIPIYDCVLVPIARTFTGKPAGMSVLQRVGTGFFISIIGMIVAAVIEKRRLETALQHGLIDMPNVTIPMSILWLLPQYALIGIAEAFTMVGLQEFFYDQVPNGLRSVGLSLYLSIFGVGNLLSGILVSVINNVTSGDRAGSSWFSDNLNRAHLDSFYWLLSGLSTVGLALFMSSVRSYKYKVPI